ncbi:MAG: FtsH protease activity modulator HflK [Arenimonas sp.]|jgi:membrane protease subunit HflK
MAWNQPGKGKQNPWSGKGSGNGLDNLLQRARDLFGGGGGNPIAWILPLLGLLLVFNSFKLIDERQRGVVLRFGEFNRIMTPGANFKWPWPIETLTVVDATKIESLDDQVRVLTKDENIVDIKFNAQYQVSDPRLFLFGFRDDLSVDGKVSQGRETLQNAAESAVREVVGNNTMDTVLFERSRLIVAARQHLQESLDMYKTGLKVTEFTLQNARPPEEVKPAFDDAISAREDKSRIESEAKAYASKIVPEARGAAQRIKAESEGYRAATIAKAEGDAQRFTLLVGQYRKAPEVTRKRLYLETMQQVLSTNQKVMAGRDNNILYLPLNGSTQPSPLPPLSQLPSVKSSSPPQSSSNEADERPARAASREGDR